MRPCVVAIACLLASSCGGLATPGGASPRAPSPPVPVPGPGISGCVESRDLKELVQALDSHRQASRRAALAALGAVPEERRGVFAEPGALKRLGDTYESGGKRYGVIAHMTPHFAPMARVAKVGASVRRVDERPSAHPVPIIACGVNACPRSGGGTVANVPARPVAIELTGGEELGEALTVSYDFWWARVSFDKRRECAPASAGDR